jgi:stearoyl-CoA desaturase (Delta-9 desaturase)
MERGFFYAHMGWLIQKKCPELVEEGKKINMKDLEADWVVSLQRKINWLLLIIMCWAVPGK